MALLKNQDRKYLMTMFIQIKCFGLSCCVAEYMVTNNAVLFLEDMNVCNTAVRISDLMPMFIFKFAILNYFLTYWICGPDSGDSCLLECDAM
jgi:hypothetical protein